MQLADILDDIYRGRSAQGAIVSDEGVKVEVVDINHFRVTFPNGKEKAYRRINPARSRDALPMRL